MVDEDESVDLSFGLEGKVTVATGDAAGIAPPLPALSERRARGSPS